MLCCPKVFFLSLAPVTYATFSDSPYGIRENNVSVEFVVTAFKRIDESVGEIEIYADIVLTWNDHRWYESVQRFVEQACEHADDSGDSDDDKFAELRSQMEPGDRDEETRFSLGFTACLTNDSATLQAYAEGYFAYEKRFGCSSMVPWRCSCLFCAATHYAPYEVAELYGSAESWKQKAIRFAKRFESTPAGVPWTPVPQMLLPNGWYGEFEHTSKTEVIPWIFGGHNPKANLFGFYAIWTDSDKTAFGFTPDFDYRYFPFDNQTLELCLNFGPLANPIRTDSYIPFNFSLENRSDFAPFEPLEVEVNHKKRVTPFMSKRAATALAAKGWIVEDVTDEHLAAGGSFYPKICNTLKIRRDPSSFIYRICLPMALLFCIPFAGFWLPIEVVMPRVATGFISFLSLQVFRSGAYAALPGKNLAYLVWLDVVLFVVSEVMFLAVVQNIAANVLNKQYSHYTSRRLDGWSRTAFPVCSFFLVCFGVALGYWQVDPLYTQVVMQLIFLILVLAMIIYIARLVLYLPQVLLRELIHEMTDERLLWQDGMELDLHELAIIFRFFDADRSGAVTKDEIIEALRANGLKFETDQEWQELDKGIELLCMKNQAHAAQMSVDLEGFRTGLKNLIGGRMMRRLHRERQVVKSSQLLGEYVKTIHEPTEEQHSLLQVQEPTKATQESVQVPAAEKQDLAPTSVVCTVVGKGKDDKADDFSPELHGRI